MNSGTVSRRQARRAAFVLLYQHDVVDGDLDALVERYEADTGERVSEYTRAVLDGVTAERASLDGLIDAAAAGWTADRLGAVERAILRLALFELTERDDVPPAAAIDEAVELAKRYATPEAAAFVNGVLGQVARQRRRGR